MEHTILVAEDDIDIVNVLKLYLQSSGYKVLTAENGEDAYEILKKEKIDLAVLDIMMPKMDGFELTEKIRETSNIPIIILSAKNQDSDKIFGLNIGADDYMTKPFNPLEILARVNSNLRRMHLNHQTAEEKSASNELVIGELNLDTQKLSLKKSNNEIILTPTEYKILALLMKYPNRVFTRSQIYENINGEYFENDDNTMMVHISKLREKIEDDPKSPKYLITIRGLGYKIENKQA